MSRTSYDANNVRFSICNIMCREDTRSRTLESPPSDESCCATLLSSASVRSIALQAIAKIIIINILSAKFGSGSLKGVCFLADGCYYVKGSQYLA